MAHDHSNCPKSSTQNVKTAFVLNFLFTIIEFVGGIYCNSVAVLADAVHDLGDTISLGLSWYMEGVSGRKRDGSFSYGYRRFSLLSALVNCIVLITGSVFILVEAVPRLLDPQPIYVPGVFFLAILGVLFNGMAALRLKQGHTLNEKVVMWHLLEDLFGWIVILIMSVIMHFWNLPILDPIFSVLFSLVILFNVIRNLKTTLAVFLQSIPDSLDLSLIEGELRDMEGVEDLHDLHVWSLDGAYHVFTLHLVVGAQYPDREIPELKRQIKRYLMEKDIQHVTLEVERAGDPCDLKHC